MSAPGRGDDGLVENLLARWLADAEAGSPPSLTDLCASRPDLLAALREMTALARTLPGAETMPADPLLGRALGGRYVLTSRLGAGGMGLVYAGRDAHLGREVAVKVLDDLFAGDRDRVARFEREAHSLAALDDPRIVAVHDLDLTASPPFLVMDRITGFDLGAFVRTLRELVPVGRLPDAHHVAAAVAELAPPSADAASELFVKPWPLLVALLGQQMCAALRAAHQLGVVHRDIKPSNFMLEPSGRLRLLDFGLARSDRDASLTGAGARVGTPLYMAPEQLRTGEGTPASDLYALGATLYELLCLQPPFAGHGTELEMKILFDEPPPPRMHRERVPRDLAAVCLKALIKNPARRYRSAADLEADLGRFAAFEPVLARPRVWPAPVRVAIGAARRYRGALLVTVVLVAAAAIGASTAGHLLGTHRALASAAEVATRRAEVARLHEGLSPFLGFAAGRADRLRDPGRAAALAALDRILTLAPGDSVARFLRLWVRGDESPPPADVAADEAALTRQFGEPRLRRLLDAARALQERARVDAAAGAAQMDAALGQLDAEPKPLDAVARRLYVTIALQLGEFDRDRRREVADLVLDAIAEDEAARRRDLADFAADYSGCTAFTWFVRGAALLMHADLRGARAAYTESDRLCPGQPSTLHGLARIHRMLGQPSEALRCVEAALAVTPEPHVNHLEQHALALQAVGQFERADAVLVRFPDDRDSQAKRHLTAACGRTLQAALVDDAAERTRLLADAEASLAVLRALAEQKHLSKQQVRALETTSGWIGVLQTASAEDRVGLCVSLLLEGPDGRAAGDPLARQLLDRLGETLLEAGQASLGRLVRAQAAALKRLEQDGVRVR